MAGTGIGLSFRSKERGVAGALPEKRLGTTDGFGEGEDDGTGVTGCEDRGGLFSELLKRLAIITDSECSESIP